MLVYHLHWHSVYFDIFAFSLSTADPFVHPVTCILVSQRYRAGYKAALKDILSKLRRCIFRACRLCRSKAKVRALEYSNSYAGSDSLSNRGSRGLEIRRSLANNRKNSDSASGIPNVKGLGVILEGQEERKV